MYSCKDVVENLKGKISKELDSINCNKVAAYSGYSVKQANRIFSAQTDINLGEYIRYRRMAQALWELRYTDMSINLILEDMYNGNRINTRLFKA